MWRAFFDSTHFTRTVALEQGDHRLVQDSERVSWARMWGAPIPLAYALQALLVACARRRADLAVAQRRAYPVKAAALCIATILATPYTFDYDMMVLAPAIAFLAVDGLVARIRAVGENSAGGALADAARRAQCRASDTHSLGGAGDARHIYSVIAAQHASTSPGRWLYPTLSLLK